jgi:hypothetical protein
LAFCKWLEQTSVGASVRQSLWLFPAIESVHLLGMAALLATVGAFDFRLMGIALRGQSISGLARRVLPWIWAAFALQVFTGALLFCSEATHMYSNPAFRLKMLLIILAGAHALFFHLAAQRNPRWDDGTTSSLFAKLAGGISLFLWIGVVAAGRWIGFI